VLDVTRGNKKYKYYGDECVFVIQQEDKANAEKERDNKKKINWTQNVS
jgi:hypothetical protein